MENNNNFNDDLKDLTAIVGDSSLKTETSVIESMINQLKARLDNQNASLLAYTKLMGALGMAIPTETGGVTDGKVDLESIDYPNFYGGAYLDENGMLILLYTDNLIKAENSFDELLPDDYYILQQVLHSYKSLCEAKELITSKCEEEIYDSIFKNITAYGINDKENYVFIEMLDLSPDTINEFKQTISSSELIVFKQGQKFIAEVTLRGGTGVQANGSGISSMGFRARSASGQNGFVMSGHSTTGAQQQVRHINSNGTLVGTVVRRQWQGAIDAAFVQATAGTTLSSQFAHNSNGLNLVTVLPAQGAFVSLAGRQDVVIRSGTVTAASINPLIEIRDAAGNLIGLIRMQNIAQAGYSSTGGDSGGTIFSSAANGGLHNLVGNHISSGGLFGRAQAILSVFQLQRF